MGAGSNRGKLVIGLAISVLFMYLAFRQVDFGQMWRALQTARYVYLLPVVAVIFFSHYLRAYRWRFLLDPIRRVDTFSLFSSLIIGYMANIFMPAHLGEFLRAYVLSKKRALSMSATFATIVMERIIDILSLLLLMVLTIFVYPFPDWVSKSGYIMFAVTLGLFAFLVLLKLYAEQTLRIVRPLLRPFPRQWAAKAEETLVRFVEGIVSLKRWTDYVVVAVLSVLIWACYGAVFYFSFLAFDFVATYHLPWTASLVLLVITTVSIVVPSSPGYVGTYHYLCQLALGMFAVPASPALAFAAVVHGANFLPVFFVGLFFAQREGMAISRMSHAAEMETLAVPAAAAGRAATQTTRSD